MQLEIHVRLQHERKWQKDSDAKSCPICASSFSLLHRRSHCRSCGKVFCRECVKEVPARVPEKKAPVLVKLCVLCAVPHETLRNDSIVKRTDRGASLQGTKSENSFSSVAGSSEMPKCYWEEDSAVQSCPQCSTSFSLVNRRSHCRMCGLVHCRKCVILRSVVVDGSRKYVKACVVCGSRDAVRNNIPQGSQPALVAQPSQPSFVAQPPQPAANSAPTQSNQPAGRGAPPSETVTPSGDEKKQEQQAVEATRGASPSSDLPAEQRNNKRDTSDSVVAEENADQTNAGEVVPDEEVKVNANDDETPQDHNAEDIDQGQADDDEEVRGEEHQLAQEDDQEDFDGEMNKEEEEEDRGDKASQGSDGRTQQKEQPAQKDDGLEDDGDVLSHSAPAPLAAFVATAPIATMVELVGSSRPEVNDAATVKYKHMLERGESVVLVAVAEKTRYMRTQRRLLVLTDLPRLFYADADTDKVKGFISLRSSDLTMKVDTPSSFTVTSHGKDYPFDLPEPNADLWVRQIAKAKAGVAAE